MSGGLLLAELMDHHGGLRDNHLILVIEQLDELRNGPGGKVGVVLIINQVDNGVLEHLAGLGESLHRGRRVRRLELRRRDLRALLQRLREHGRPHTLAPSVAQLLVDI